MYERLPVNDRISFNCSNVGNNFVENEQHVLLHCPSCAELLYVELFLM